MTRPALATLAAAAVLAAACAPRPAGPVAEPTGASTQPAPTPGIVDGPTARELVRAGARLVDVRTPEEYAAGHLPGAVNLPVDQVARRSAEIGPRGAPVVLYCRSGRRSGIAAETLRGLGFERVYDVQTAERWAAGDPQGARAGQ